MEVIDGPFLKKRGNSFGPQLMMQFCQTNRSGSGRHVWYCGICLRRIFQLDQNFAWRRLESLRWQTGFDTEEKKAKKQCSLEQDKYKLKIKSDEVPII